MTFLKWSFAAIIVLFLAGVVMAIQAIIITEGL